MHLAPITHLTDGSLSTLTALLSLQLLAPSPQGATSPLHSLPSLSRGWGGQGTQGTEL